MDQSRGLNQQNRNLYQYTSNYQTNQNQPFQSVQQSPQIQYVPVPVPMNQYYNPFQSYPQQQYPQNQQYPVQSHFMNQYPQQQSNPYIQMINNPYNYQLPQQNYQYANSLQPNLVQFQQKQNNNNDYLNMTNSYFKPNNKKKQIKERKPDPFKNKNADQIVNEFKAFTLPKLRMRRLVKLQALMKGHYTRKYLIPRKRQDIQIMKNYVDRFLKIQIEDKIIPDLVLEILTYNKYNEDVSMYSTEYKAQLEIMDKILLKVIKDMSRFIVRESTDNLVGNILKKYNEKKPLEEKDPFSLLVKDIITNSIKEDCKIIAKQSIEELSQDYLQEIHLRSIIKDKFLNKAIKEVVIDSIEEVIIESIIDDKVTKLSADLAQPLASSLYEQVQQEVEGVELDRALDVYVNRGILDAVLEQLAVLMEEEIKIKNDLDQKEKRNKILQQQLNKK